MQCTAALCHCQSCVCDSHMPGCCAALGASSRLLCFRRHSSPTSPASHQRSLRTQPQQRCGWCLCPVQLMDQTRPTWIKPGHMADGQSVHVLPHSVDRLHMHVLPHMHTHTNTDWKLAAVVFVLHTGDSPHIKLIVFGYSQCYGNWGPAKHGVTMKHFACMFIRGLGRLAAWPFNTYCHLFACVCASRSTWL